MGDLVLISEHAHDVPSLDFFWDTKSLKTLREEKPRYVYWQTKKTGFMYCEKARTLCGRLVIDEDGVERFTLSVPPKASVVAEAEATGPKIVKTYTFI